MGTPLGDYLRARRERVQPERAGLPARGRRRVPGLRREEVALLAGISVDYYLRLEQGRDDHPSREVLVALARALQLDAAATAHLLALGDPEPRPEPAARLDDVPPGIRILLAAIQLPAFVENRRFDVLAANALATALSPALRGGANRLRALFLDPDERALCPDFERAAAHQVASFRQSIGGATDDPRVVALVAELARASDQFRALWARHDVLGPEGTRRPMIHPVLGAIALHKERLEIGGAPDLRLVVYHAEPGTESAAQLARLLAECGDAQAASVAPAGASSQRRSPR